MIYAICAACAVVGWFTGIYCCREYSIDSLVKKSKIHFPNESERWRVVKFVILVLRDSEFSPEDFEFVAGEPHK